MVMGRGGGLDLVIGEGNSNPLQYSCLENPRDRGESQEQRRIPGTEEPGGLPSLGLQRVGHD